MWAFNIKTKTVTRIPSFKSDGYKRYEPGGKENPFFNEHHNWRPVWFHRKNRLLVWVVGGRHILTLTFDPNDDLEDPGTLRAFGDTADGFSLNRDAYQVAFENATGKHSRPLRSLSFEIEA